MTRVEVHKFAMDVPDDLSALRTALDAGIVRAEQIVALISSVIGDTAV